MITSLARPIFLRRADVLERNETRAEELQTDTLRRLVREGRGTLWGADHHFDRIRDYDSFTHEIGISGYDVHKPYVERMLSGGRDILCRGLVRHFAVSSGTSGNDRKVIPVSDAGLRDTHLKGGFDSLACYLHNNPSSRILDGKSLVLGGYYLDGNHFAGCRTGHVSAILIDNMNPLVSRFRIPGRDIALEPDFGKKTAAIAAMSSGYNVTSISGIPAWVLAQIKKVLEYTGRKNLSEVWPDLEVFFHGGTSFSRYRSMFGELIPSAGMHYLETYNASEGFFSMQNDLSDPSMLLMTDYGVFYEFVPLDGGDTLPLWGIKEGIDYSMLITTSSGLWRYPIGDVVRFTDTDPYKFMIVGRTSEYINISGEKLDAHAARKALEETCTAFGARVIEYTVAPCPAGMSETGHHQWLIEFDTEPDDLVSFKRALDDNVKKHNEVYCALRTWDETLGELEIISARKGLFEDYLARHGMLGGQTKIPVIRDNRSLIEEMLAL